MTPETRAKLEQKLNEHGLTVLLTKDWDGILIQLARLAQFEREMTTEAAGNGTVGEAVFRVKYTQEVMVRIADETDLRPLDIMDIPIILTAAHKNLHDQLGKPAMLDSNTVHAAVSAFVGILCRR